LSRRTKSFQLEALSRRQLHRQHLASSLLAKRVIQLHGVNEREVAVLRRSISVERFAEFICGCPPCVVAMEACSTAHHWARKLSAIGRSVKLIAPHFVAPYRKGGASGNDAADAEAICEAASRPSMRYVPVKTVEQQGIAALHRIRQGWVEERTALINRLRGLLAEFGLALPQRTAALEQIPRLAGRCKQRCTRHRPVRAACRLGAPEADRAAAGAGRRSDRISHRRIVSCSPPT
jgi:transposase